MLAMQLKDIDVKDSIAKAKLALSETKGLDPSIKSIFSLLILILEFLLPQTIRATSKNSNLPPSKDLTNSIKKKTRAKSEKKSGGQAGHAGKTLELVSNPDEVIDLKIDKSTLPKGKKLKSLPARIRQVFNILITRRVTEYRGEVLCDEDGQEYVAKFPEEITSQTQYGNSIRKEVCYHSVFQMTPMLRIQDYFKSHGIPISEGTIDNILSLAFDKLKPFESFVKLRLLQEKLIHVDETGGNVNGKNAWIHTTSSEKYTYLYGDFKRGKEGIDNAEILPFFTSYVVHDHWQAYLGYTKSTHIFCNDHIRRELQRVIDTTNHSWALKMQSFLQELNKVAPKAPPNYEKQYKRILTLANKQCPEDKTKRAKSKERNLINRLIKYKNGTLAFATNKEIPFTNNLAERDLRMLKVKLKVSGCFKTIDSLRRFCLLRSFVSTCIKNQINISFAFEKLFDNKLDEILNLMPQGAE